MAPGPAADASRRAAVAAAADLAVDATGVHLAGVAYFDRAGCLRMDAAAGHRTPAWPDLRIGRASTAHRVRRSKRLVTLGDYATESGCAPWLVDMFCGGEGCSALATVPLWRADDVCGVLYGGMRGRAPIGDRTLLALERIARVLSVADAPVAAPAPPADGWAAAPRLSHREREMLALLAEGVSTTAIAEATFLTTNSVRTYIQGALGKLGAGSRLEAVATARRLGLIP
jgi:DNA-binding CsgD family transcriptional regulator